MVEDYVPDRLEFELASKAKGMSKTSAGGDHRRRPLSLRRAGRQARARRRGGRLARERAAGFCRLSVRARATKRSRPSASRSTTCRTPMTNGKARLRRRLEKQPATTRPLEAQVIIRMAEAGGRAVERKLTLPVIPGGPMIGIKPLFSGRSLGEGENATFDVVLASPDGTSLAANGLRYELLRVETKYQWYRRDGAWDFEPVKIDQTRRRRPDRRRRRQAGAHLGAGAMGPLSPRSVDRRPQRPGDLDRLRCRLVCGGERRHARPAGNRARQAGIRGRARA